MTGLRFEGIHSENSANDAGVHAEKHSTEARLFIYQLQTKWLIYSKVLTEQASA